MMIFLVFHSECHNSILYDYSDILSSWTELWVKDQMLSYLRFFFSFLWFKIHSLQLSPSAKPWRLSKIIEVLWNREQNLLSKSTHMKEDLCSEPLETCLGYWELVAWKRYQDFFMLEAMAYNVFNSKPFVSH